MTNNSSLEIASNHNDSPSNYASFNRGMNGPAIIAWSTAFILESVLIIMGNTLTILTFLKFRLRQNRTFYFLINLALADFVVGCLTIPLFVYVFINYFRGVHIDIKVLLTHNIVEVFTQYLALFSLALVSMERMFAVVWPLIHRRAPFYTYLICILHTWALAAVVPSFHYMPFPSVARAAYYLYFIFFTTALLIICVSYMIVWSWVTCKRPTIINRHHEADRRLARTLVLVTIVSLVAWLPFQLINYVINLCSTCEKIPMIIVYLSKMLHYGNSLVNPILYCFRIPDFYQTTRSILRMSRNQNGGNPNDSIELRRQTNGEVSHLGGHSACSYNSIRPPINKSKESCLDV